MIHHDFLPRAPNALALSHLFYYLKYLLSLSLSDFYIYKYRGREARQRGKEKKREAESGRKRTKNLRVLSQLQKS